MYTKNDRKMTFNDWTDFVVHRKPTTTHVREEIRQSWKRSIEYDIDPLAFNCPYITPAELNDRLTKNKTLIDLARPYMNKLVEIVEGSEFIVVLTDSDGVVLESMGDARILQKEESSHAGADRSERAIGCNAVGTSLFLNKPIQIWAEENYSKCYHEWTCSAAPIHDVKNTIVGCIDLSGYSENAHSHTLGMAKASADSIERQLRLENTYREVIYMNNLQKATLSSISEGIIVIDSNEKIIQANKYIYDVLRKPSDSLTGVPIHTVLECGDIFTELLSLRKNIHDVEMKMLHEKNVIHCYISATNFMSEQEDPCLVIVIKEVKHVRTLVHKMIGSKAVIDFSSIIGVSPKYQEVVNLAKNGARSPSNVLLMGESGTGKEMFAQAIHNYSDRQAGPFIDINCGAIPRNLIESELFGYEGGAFTGSKKEGHMGKFELADGGTLFLDEIGDMPLDLQVVLLRVLQNKEVVRIGGYKAKHIDVRIIASTNIDLEDAIRDGRFRRDLYYRLNVLTIKIPSLRERPDDIEPLVRHFIDKYNLKLGRTILGIEDATCRKLEKYRWPGNVRELENAIERAMNITNNQYLSDDDFQHIDTVDPLLRTQHRLGDAHRSVLINELVRHTGNIRKTALSLGVGRSTIYRMLEKYDINIENFRHSNLRS